MFEWALIRHRYRIINRQSRFAISVGPRDIANRREETLEYPVAPDLALSVSESDYHELWYIQRDKTADFKPQRRITEPNLYTIRSCATALYLDAGDAAARQRHDGVQPWATPSQMIYTTQQWRITKQSAEGWTIESRVVGSVLDSSGVVKLPFWQGRLQEAGSEGVLVAKPRLLNQTLQTQMWVMDPVTCSLSSGKNTWTSFVL